MRHKRELIINYQLSIVNYQLSTVNCQLSTVNYQLKKTMAIKVNARETELKEGHTDSVDYTDFVN